MTDTKQPSERDLLKERATDLGIEFAANVPTEKLRELVNEKLAPKAEVTTASPRQTRYKELRDKALKLHRVRITCLNPNKKEAEAEFFRASNSIVGINRLVPFEVDTHVEDILLKHVKSRKFAQVRNEKNADGKVRPVRVMRNEFQIEFLEPLTEEELKNLAAEQSKRQSV